MIILFVIELYMDLFPKNWYAFQSIIQKERKDVNFHLEKENSNESFMTMFSWWHQQFPVFRTNLSERVPARRGKDWQNISFPIPDSTLIVSQPYNPQMRVLVMLLYHLVHNESVLAPEPKAVILSLLRRL